MARLDRASEVSSPNVSLAAALILLSATPHDGSRQSFASLMCMLDPTSIVGLDNYGPDDIKGLFIRRFRTTKEVKRGFARPQMTRAGNGIFSDRETPLLFQSREMVPPKPVSTAFSRMAPNPSRAVASSKGVEPRSSHFTWRSSPIAETSMVNRPLEDDNAPYFAAFVVSS
jgi:hypothetical protein